MGTLLLLASLLKPNFGYVTEPLTSPKSMTKLGLPAEVTPPYILNHMLIEYGALSVDKSPTTRELVESQVTLDLPNTLSVKLYSGHPVAPFAVPRSEER